VGQDSEVYVGLDTSKLKISVAIADAGRAGEVRFFGDINSTPEAVERLVTKLSKRRSRLSFCYVYRQIAALGHQCIVIALVN
jgi:transposase